MVRKLAKHFGSSAVWTSLVAVLMIVAAADAHGQASDLGFLGIGAYETTVPGALVRRADARRKPSDVVARRPELCRLPPVADAESISSKPAEIPQPTTAPAKNKVAQDIPTAVVGEIVNPAAVIGSYVGRWAAGGSRENGPKPKNHSEDPAATND